MRDVSHADLSDLFSVALERKSSGSSLTPNRYFWNSAGIAPGLNQVIETVKNFADTHLANGFFGVEQRFEAYQIAREQLSGLFLGLTPEQICPTMNCASAINLAACSLPGFKGGNFLTWDNEYSSNAYIWHRFCKERGLEHKTCDWEEDGSLDTAKLCAAINADTKVVSVSWVQSQTGAETDLKMLGEACRRVGAWLVVDAIQGIGAKKMDLSQMVGVDIVCTGSHKWLCAPMGAGFLSLVSERARKLKPFFEGGHTYGLPQETVDWSVPIREDADCFSPGSVPILMMAAMGAGASALTNVGLDRVWQQLVGQKEQIRDRLLAGPWKICGSADMGQGNGGVTYQNTKGREATESAFTKLTENGVSCSLKPCGLRLSPHAHVSPKEIDAVCGLVDG